MKHHQILFVASLFALIILGCQSTDPRLGYTSRSLFNDRIKSVQVNIFSTKEFRRGLEFELAEALVKRIESDTPYKVLKDSQADTVLDGQLVKVRQSVLADLYSSDLPAEKQQQLVVNFTWKDRRSGRILAEAQGVRVVAEYTPPVGETFATGQQELMDEMARKIVKQMRQTW